MPWARWHFATDGHFSHFCYAREVANYLIGDKIGGVYRLDQAGSTLALTRLSLPVTRIAWSDLGQMGFCLLGTKILARLNRKLETEWEIESNKEILDITIDPYGNFVAISMADATISIIDYERNRVAEYETPRPMDWIQFRMEEPTLIAASSNGLIYSFSMSGAKNWNENLWSAIGGFDIAHGRRMLYVAGHNLGVMQLDVNTGKSKGALVVDGTVNKVATSFDGARIAGSTIEKKFFWLDTDGEMIFTCDLPDVVSCLSINPLGQNCCVGLNGGPLTCLDWSNQDRFLKTMKMAKQKKSSS